MESARGGCPGPRIRARARGLQFLAFYQNIMKQAQLKITAHIHSIKLQVRFPCSVTASLRIEHEEIPYGQEVPLRLGEAVFDMGASHQFTVLFDSHRNAFEEKKISVLLFLKSSSGRIPAGAVILSLNSIGQNQTRHSYGVEKCPDKQAAVELSLSCECLNEIDCVPLNPPTNRSNKSDQELRMSFGNEKRKAVQRSLIMKEDARNNSREGEHSVEGESRELMSSHSGARLDLPGDEPSPFRSPSKAQFQDYASKSKIQQLQRELKNLQGKYQQQNLQLKGSLAKKEIMERSLKDTEGQLRIVRERYSDLQAEYDNSLKKTQFRDGSLREQLRTVTQKLAHAEAQIQKMIFQKNDLVNDFEQRERDLRFGLREREKGVNQDKIKLSKKLEQMTSLYNQLKDQFADGDVREAELVKELAKEKKRCEEEELAKNDIVHEANILKDQLKSERQQRKQLEEALASNEQLEEEKKKFRKKIGDLQQELNVQIKNNSTSEAAVQRLTKKVEELEEGLKEKIGIVKSQSKEIEALNKQIQNLKINIADRDKKIDQLSASKQKEGAKLQHSVKELGQNLRRTQEDLAEHKKRIKEKETVIAGLKEQMETDFDDISNMNKKNSQLEIQLAEKNTQLHQLKYEHEEVFLEKDSLATEKTELEVQLDSYVHELQQLQKQYQSTSIQREEERKKFQKQISTLQHRLDNSSEESSFQVAELKRKITSLQHDCKLKEQEIGQQKTCIQNLESDNMKNMHLNEQLEHNLKLRVNQIAFLNQSLQKANQDISAGIAENKELSTQIDQLNQSVDQLTRDLELRTEELEKANSSGSTTQQQLQQYKDKNTQNLTAFLEAIDGGLIELGPRHQDGNLQKLMAEAIRRNNSQVKEKTALLSKLEEESRALNEEVSDLQQANSNLGKDLKETTDLLSEEIKKNSKLNQNMKILEETFEKQKNQMLNNSSSQTGKLNDKIQKLETQLGELKSRFEEQTRNLNQSKQELAKTKKELKEYTNNSSGQLKSLRAQVQKLETDVERKRKEIQSKAATILKYGDIEKELREKLEGSNTQISSLKEINENIRKRNQQGTTREKELQNQLSKTKEQRDVQMKKQENAQKQLRQQVEALKLSAKGKEDQLRNLEHNLKNAKSDISSHQKDFKQKQSVFTQKIKELQVSLDNERRSSSKEVEKLNKLSQDADKHKAQLQGKISELVRTLEQRQKVQHLEEEHLKPIKEHLSFLKGYMAEYSRVGDQFEGSKNKLLKLSHTRLQQYSERNVAEKLREVSFVFQKLKAFLLFSTGLSDKQKEGVVEELKKMQFSIDRSLRGDR